MIHSDTGTGKEHLARYIHENSVRLEQSYMPINCSALNDELLKSSLNDESLLKPVDNPIDFEGEQQGLFE